MACQLHDGQARFVYADQCLARMCEGALGLVHLRPSTLCSSIHFEEGTIDRQIPVKSLGSSLLTVPLKVYVLFLGRGMTWHVNYQMSLGIPVH